MKQKIYSAKMPEMLMEKLKKLAKVNARSASAEMRIAIEKHVGEKK